MGGLMYTSGSHCLSARRNARLTFENAYYTRQVAILANPHCLTTDSKSHWA